MTTEPKTVARHFTTEAFGPRDRVEACHEVYGRAIAKIDLAPQADEIMIDAKFRTLPGLGLVSMTSTEFRFRRPANWSTTTTSSC